MALKVLRAEYVLAGEKAGGAALNNKFSVVVDRPNSSSSAIRTRYGESATSATTSFCDRIDSSGIEQAHLAVEPLLVVDGDDKSDSVKK